MNKSQNELKQELKKKCNEISKILILNEALIKEVQNLKQEKVSKGRKENEH